LLPGYHEWLPPAALRPAVSCLWAQVTPDGAGRHALVLPDACTDLVWEQGRGAFVAGPDTGPVPTRMAAGTVVVGVRFRPAAGGPVLGVPLSELRDQRVDLADLRSGDASRLPGTLDPDTALARTLDVAASLVAGGQTDPAVTRAVSLLRDPRARTKDVAADVGLSLRQLRRRCDAAVGYGPKTLQRVLRFRRFVARIDAVRVAPAAGRDTGDLAAIAAGSEDLSGRHGRLWSATGQRLGGGPGYRPNSTNPPSKAVVTRTTQAARAQGPLPLSGGSGLCGGSGLLPYPQPTAKPGSTTETRNPSVNQ